MLRSGRSTHRLQAVWEGLCEPAGNTEPDVQSPAPRRSAATMPCPTCQRSLHPLLAGSSLGAAAAPLASCQVA